MSSLGCKLFNAGVVGRVADAYPTVFEQEVIASDERDPITILTPSLDV